MAERYGFFDAVVTNGVADRVYSADDVNNVFKGLLSDGVYRLYENALNITVGTGLSVNVNTGKAIVKDHWYINTTIKNLALTPAHATLSRYSSVVLRYDRGNRSVTLATIDGSPAGTPVAPVLTQDSDIYEIRLANVLVGAGATSLTADKVIDQRSYSSGLVDATPLAYRRYDVVQTGYPSGQRYFDIPDSYNFTANTILQVFSNGLLCAPTDYTIQVNEVEGNYMVVFTVARTLNTELSFVMIN